MHIGIQMKKVTLGSGKWIKLEEIEYQDKNQNTRKWERASRLNDLGAVGILATLQPTNRLILIKQFRPPVNNTVIELPAGLIDKGETTNQAAERELKEETGYTGVIEYIYPATCSSPGLTDEKIAIAVMTIDETLTVNQNVVQSLEPSEDIEVILIKKAELKSYLLQEMDAGHDCDAKLFSYAMAL